MIRSPTRAGATQRVARRPDGPELDCRRTRRISFERRSESRSCLGELLSARGRCEHLRGRRQLTMSLSSGSKSAPDAPIAAVVASLRDAGRLTRAERGSTARFDDPVSVLRRARLRGTARRGRARTGRGVRARGVVRMVARRALPLLTCGARRCGCCFGCCVSTAWLITIRRWTCGFRRVRRFELGRCVMTRLHLVGASRSRRCVILASLPRGRSPRPRCAPPS